MRILYGDRLNMNNFENNMEKAFGLDSTEVVVVEDVEELSVEVDKNQSPIDKDYEIAIESQRNVIITATDALKEVLLLAKSDDAPRAYEVTGQIIKALSEANKDLLELSEKKQKLDGTTNKPQTVNNTMFVGNTKEVLQMLRDNKNKS